MKENKSSIKSFKENVFKTENYKETGKGSLESESDYVSYQSHIRFSKMGLSDSDEGDIQDEKELPKKDQFSSENSNFMSFDPNSRFSRGRVEVEEENRIMFIGGGFG